MDHIFACMHMRDDRVAFLDHVHSITQTHFPDLGVPQQTFRSDFPEIDGGWIASHPAVADPLVSQKIGHDVAVLVYGRLFTAPPAQTASRIMTAWRQGGAAAVQQLDGSFSAILIDRLAKRLYALSDQVGQRALRYWHDGHHLFISTQDVSLMATGLVPLHLDHAAVHDLMLFGWSLNGRSLIPAITPLQPYHYLISDQQGIRLCQAPTILSSSRMSAPTPAAQQTHLDQMIDHMQTVVRQMVQDKPLVDTDLTAGMDSRASLALLTTVVSPKRIRTRTLGDPASMDAYVAQQLAQRVGATHEMIPWQSVSLDQFLAHSRALALVANGNSNSKRAIQNPMPHLDPHQPPHLHGVGGELYRGYYYPPLSTAPHTMSPEQMARQVAKGIYRRLPHINWPDPELIEQQLHQRVWQTMGNFAAAAIPTADWLDAFFLYELVGHWADFSARGSWWKHSFTPFVSPKVVRMAFQLPAPIGAGHLLHKRLLSRFSPSLRWVSVNFETFLPLMGTRWERPLFKKRLRRVMTIRHKLWLRQRGLAGVSLRGMLDPWYVEHLPQGLSDLLLRQGGVGDQVLGKTAVSQLITEQLRGQHSHAPVLGSLIMAELAYEQLCDAHAKGVERPFSSSFSRLPALYQRPYQLVGDHA